MRLEISLLCALIIISLIFYLFPRIAENFSNNNSSAKPDFIIIDIPQTFQIYKKAMPAKPEISSQYEEVEMMEDVVIVETREIDSTFYMDSTLANLLYYENLLPYLGLEKFDPKSLKEEKEPLDHYREYLFEKLTKIYNDKNSFKIKSNVDDILAQSMGRDPNMLMVDIVAVIENTKRYINSKVNRNITINNIINTEHDWHILAVIWEKTSPTVFEIYEDEYVKKSNSVSSLKESLNNLEENGFVIEIEGFESDRYLPTFSSEKMIDLVNRFLARDLTNQQKDKLSSFLNFIIMSS